MGSCCLCFCVIVCAVTSRFILVAFSSKNQRPSHHRPQAQCAFTDRCAACVCVGMCLCVFCMRALSSCPQSFASVRRMAKSAKNKHHSALLAWPHAPTTANPLLIDRFTSCHLSNCAVCQFVIVDNGDVPSRYLWLTVGAGYWEPFGTVLACLSH